MKAWLLLLGLLVAAGLAVVTAARVPAGLSAPPGPCWVRLNDDPTEYPSVQAAVDASTNPSDVVKVAGYCAGVERRAGFTQTVYLSKTLTLQGGYTLTNWTTPDPQAYPTTLDALGKGRVLLVYGKVAPRISGLRLTGGDAALAGFDPYGHNRGGGLYAFEAYLTISDCIIYSNTAASGGGIYTYAGRLTMYGSTVAGNSALFSGGGMLMYEGVGRSEGNTFISNTAGAGGGAYFGSEVVTLTHNAFLSNTALYDGGGVIVEVYGGHSKLVENTVVGNRAYWNGGGLYFGEGVLGQVLPRFRSPKGGAYLLLAGNLVAHNWARNHGGGVLLSGDGGAPDFIGNTVLENESGGNGGGIYLDWSADPTPILSNTVEGNVAGGNGGGIYLGTETATLRGNIIRDNHAAGDGGGVYGRGGRIEANRIASNIAARRGGGLALENGTSVLVNNWIADNRTALEGDALAVVGVARTAHNTIATVATGGSAVYVGASPPLYGSLWMTNTILVSHTIGITVAAGCTATLEATLWSNGTDWAGPGTILTGTVNVWGDPAFLDPAGGDYHIGPASAARDTGVASGVSTDIDGDTRPLGAGYDIGADEAPVVYVRMYLPLVRR